MTSHSVEKTIVDMSASAISARLEQVSQLFEVSLMLKSAKKVASPFTQDIALPDRPGESCSENCGHEFYGNGRP